MTRWLSPLLALLALPTVASCGESPDPGYLLNRQRVVGAIRTVVSEPERTTPRPGETVRMAWQTIAPGRVESHSWLFLACAPSDQAFGVPVCGAEPFEIFSQVEPQEDPPTIDIDVPADYDAEQVVVLGLVCMGGQVNTALDPTSSIDDLEPCQDGVGTGEIVSATITVEQRPELRNLRPRLNALLLEGEELTEDIAEARQPCVDGSLPVVRLDEEVQLTIRGEPDQRETYIDPILDEERTEELQNSLFVTEGTLNRRFTFIDEGTPEPMVEFLAEPDADDPLPPEGRTVKLVVVLRDRRGGEDILSRGFCLLR